MNNLLDLNEQRIWKLFLKNYQYHAYKTQSLLHNFNLSLKNLCLLIMWWIPILSTLKKCKPILSISTKNAVIKPDMLPTTQTIFFNFSLVYFFQTKNEPMNCVKNLSNLLRKNLFSSFSVSKFFWHNKSGYITGLFWSVNYWVWSVNYQILSKSNKIVIECFSLVGVIVLTSFHLISILLQFCGHF